MFLSHPRVSDVVYVTARKSTSLSEFARSVVSACGLPAPTRVSVEAEGRQLAVVDGLGDVISLNATQPDADAAAAATVQSLGLHYLEFVDVTVFSLADEHATRIAPHTTGGSSALRAAAAARAFTRHDDAEADVMAENAALRREVRRLRDLLAKHGVSDDAPAATSPHAAVAAHAPAAEVTAAAFTVDLPAATKKAAAASHTSAFAIDIGGSSSSSSSSSKASAFAIDLSHSAAAAAPATVSIGGAASAKVDSGFTIDLGGGSSSKKASSKAFAIDFGKASVDHGSL